MPNLATLLPADVKAMMVVVMLILSVIFIIRFIKENGFFGKMTNFCMAVIQLMVGLWIWFGQSAIVVTVNGNAHGSILELIFYFSIMASLITYLVLTVVEALMPSVRAKSTKN